MSTPKEYREVELDKLKQIRAYVRDANDAKVTYNVDSPEEMAAEAIRLMRRELFHAIRELNHIIGDATDIKYPNPL